VPSSYEEVVPIPSLNPDTYDFPNPHFASDEGLLAYGGDLSSGRLLVAYQQGIFPWYNAGDPIFWWSPNPRLLLYPQNFKVRKSFARVLRSGKFEVKFDTAFEHVISHCATIKREGQKSSWILPQMQKAYTHLHHEGYAHSVEVYQKGELVGGLYGISLGGAFFGESMFSLVSNASKVAFKALSDVLAVRGYDFIDCQMKTEHMVRLGAQEMPREQFLEALAVSQKKPSIVGSWQSFHWEYKDGQ
jgi:leucyl/phenylalanyl-tRNA--protein transferase